MQIAEEADGAAVRAHVHEHMGGGRLGDALGGDLAAVLVERLKMLAVDLHVLRLLAAEHGVGLRAGRDQNRARRQDDVVRRSARAQPKRSSRTSCGVNRSAKPIPSSSAFATSS